MNRDALFSPLDREFAALLGRLAPGSGWELELAALLTSQAQANGHSCLKLRDVAGQVVGADERRAPGLEDWVEKLRASGVVGGAGSGEFFPLILDDAARLYTKRFWDYEQTLARQILARRDGTAPGIDEGRLRARLDRLFPAVDEGDRQRQAALRAVTRRFAVISGGPGTGKTRTVVAILALLLEQGPSRIALAAPTGKAAARLKESIDAAPERATLPGWPTEVSTLHRLLGTIPNSVSFRHHAGAPLAVDTVIVDEASMVDLALMAKLFDALPAGARVILLGDKDQLASVEAGCVLGDVCAGVAGNVVELKRNYRFAPEGGIYRLSQAINAGDEVEVLRILKESGEAGGSADLAWRDLPAGRSMETALRAAAVAGFRAYLEATEPGEALERWGAFQILCAVRHGTHGVNEVNRLVELALREAGLLPAEPGIWYRGRPVTMTRNDYQAQLFNGDLGLCWPDPEAGGEGRFFFRAPDGTLRRVLPSRLPEHETAFAMTVHRSQGSEFERVLMILPERESVVLTRELLYTGVTRARSAVEVWGRTGALAVAVRRKVGRNSGLQEALGAPGVGQPPGGTWRGDLFGNPG